MNESSSGFIVPADFSSEWRDVSLIQKRARTLVYVGTRYGRRFVLKAISPEFADLTDYRLQQEQEFQLGIQLVHPNIAATYSLEEINGVGRCIVQEWIDGVTLGEWLQTKPAKAAQERVFAQILDALEYLHGLQLVHHDLKVDNILITRNGSNVKLIDFGLSAADATLSPVSNDPRTDIEAIRLLFPTLCPAGEFANITTLRRTIQRRKRIVRMLPVMLSVLLLAVAATLFYISWHERNTSQTEHNLLLQELEEERQKEREAVESLVAAREQLEEQNRTQAELTSELAQTTMQLAESRRELEATKQVIHNGVEVDEIRAVIDSIYQPVYDSLLLPEAQYYEIASMYVSLLPQPMKEYNRLSARYEVGSVAYATFTETWQSVYNNKVTDLNNRIKSLPNYTLEYNQHHISHEEYMRLIDIQRGIYNRHNNNSKYTKKSQ